MDGRPATSTLGPAVPTVPPVPPGANGSYADGPDADVGDGLMIVAWVFWSLASVVLMSRLVAAIAFVNQLRPSEYLMMAAYLCATVQNALITISLRDGLGHHTWFLTPDQIDASLRFGCYTQGWSIAAASLARISCCVFLLGFVSQFQRHRWSLWTLLVLQVLTGVLIIIVIYVTPPTMPLVVLVATAVVASLVKLAIAHRLEAFDDPVWNLVGLTVWVVLEGYVIIICGSIPMLRPFFRLVGAGKSRQDHLPNNAEHFRGSRGYTFRIQGETPGAQLERVKVARNGHWDDGQGSERRASSS
ncbi:hypothetical protein QBC47DRAFT_441941 [Echria macrotheca]|uniref:Rhodopsin domain-containing protein n=1 Tax=Echria macrotheca TaxID=438768 RepID=A0AAJ0B0H1_9PEZI|nr:hypothetical protein QBC47DRAFT_441941 [Echria macrotheca]